MGRFGALNILYNNAAIAGNPKGSILETSAEEDWDHVLDVNLKGAFFCTKFAVPEIRKAGGGAIINTSSISAFVGTPGGNHAYAATKGGIVTLTKTMALELAKWNIRVNAVAPGYVDTPLGRGRQSGLSEAQQEKWVAHMGRIIPMSRFARPEEIASAALYLASDEASYVTGHVLVVDGGYSAR